jgi:hypothetical protein
VLTRAGHWSLCWIRRNQFRSSHSLNLNSVQLSQTSPARFLTTKSAGNFSIRTNCRRYEKSKNSDSVLAFTSFCCECVTGFRCLKLKAVNFSIRTNCCRYYKSKNSDSVLASTSFCCECVTGFRCLKLKAVNFSIRTNCRRYYKSKNSDSVLASTSFCCECITGVRWLKVNLLFHLQPQVLSPSLTAMRCLKLCLGSWLLACKTHTLTYTHVHTLVQPWDLPASRCATAL